MKTIFSKKIPPRTLAEMIAACKFDCSIDPRIDEVAFPVKPERFTTDGLYLLANDMAMWTVDLLAELDKCRVKAATIEQLLAYGAKNPDEQRRYPIVGLGSFWVNRANQCEIPCLNGSSRLRSLFLKHDDPKESWKAGYRFLVSDK
jgi:hypothetical protein